MIVDIMTIQSQLVSILIIIQRKGLRMSANSPFSRYYRNFIDQNQAKRQIQSAPRAAIQELPTQATNNHRDFNIFDALLDKEERVERPKIEPKIKVFGLGLRKSKKDQQKSDFLKRGQDQFKNQVQNSHNLLSSLESLPENYYQKECVSGVQNESPEQLRKLLQLESGGHEQEEKEDINSEQQINEIETPLKLTESEDIEFKLPKKSEEIQLFLNKVPMTINKQEESRKLNLIEKTESCEIPPMGVVGEHPSNKQIEGRSMNSSKIRSIFDHCSELFGQNFEIPEQCQSVENPITNEVEESQIITERESRNSKANSDSPLSPNSHLKVQNNNNNYKLSTVSGQVMKSSKTPKTPTRVDVPITRKFAKPPLIKTKKETNERSNVFIEQSSSVSKNKRGIELKKYLSLDSHYNYQVDKLINRYEKVSALEQKKRQIKEQLQKLAPKKSQTNINRFDKNYYLPVNKFPSHEQNFDYFYGDPQPQKQSALFASAPPTKRQKLVHQVDCDKTSPPVEYQNDLQKQLNKNVENMEKIINKFKLLSKQISNQSQDYIHSQYLQQANSNLRQAEINIKKIEVDQSSELESSNAYVKQLNRHFFSTTESPKDIKQISSRFQVQHPGGSDSIIDSVQQISLSKELAGATQRINPNFQSSKPTETGKQTARTEKTGMTRRRKHPSAQQRYSSHHCLEDHQYLTEQLSRLNSKIEQLEKRERSHLQQLKSEEKMKNAMDLPKNNLKVKLDQHSVESDYQEEADQSIPILETVRYQDLYQEKKQKKISLEKKKASSQSPSKVQYPVKGILKEKSGLKINQKVIKKMKLKFPILEKFPSRQDSLATLVSLGQYTLSILLKFVKNRIHIDSKKLKIEGNLKVKKFIDCIHYSIPHFEYNLIFYFSGKLYFGHWNKQLVNGQGYKHGFGYYLKPKKYIYEGEFQLNKKHGKGLLNTFKGQIYDGDWMKGKKCGYGTLINQTGDIYQGFFEDGKKCGTGEEQLANGDYYRGEFKKGKLNGSGVYIWVDGSIYKGEFKNGLLNGHGIWRSKDNDCYQGQYKDNKKHGKGTYTWSNGQCFTGEFYQDQNIAKRPSFTNFSKKQSLNSPRPRNNEQIRSGRKSKGKRK